MQTRNEPNETEWCKRTADINSTRNMEQRDPVGMGLDMPHMPYHRSEDYRKC